MRVTDRGLLPDRTGGFDARSGTDDRIPQGSGGSPSPRRSGHRSSGVMSGETASKSTSPPDGIPGRRRAAAGSRCCGITSFDPLTEPPRRVGVPLTELPGRVGGCVGPGGGCEVALVTRAGGWGPTASGNGDWSRSPWQQAPCIRPAMHPAWLRWFRGAAFGSAVTLCPGCSRHAFAARAQAPFQPARRPRRSRCDAVFHP